MNCEQDMTIEVDLKTLGLSPDKAYHLWEFWEQKYIGMVKDKFSLTLKCPSCRLVAIVEARNYPWVLSTDFHFSQGACELSEVTWDAKQAVLSGILRRPPGTRGALILTVPSGYQPSRHWWASPEQAGPGVYRHALTATAIATPWTIAFEKERT
jgi:hypothetical protein